MKTGPLLAFLTGTVGLGAAAIGLGACAPQMSDEQHRAMLQTAAAGHPLPTLTAMPTPTLVPTMAPLNVTNTVEIHNQQLLPPIEDGDKEIAPGITRNDLIAGWSNINWQRISAIRDALDNAPQLDDKITPDTVKADLNAYAEEFAPGFYIVKYKQPLDGAGAKTQYLETMDDGRVIFRYMESTDPRLLPVDKHSIKVHESTHLAQLLEIYNKLKSILSDIKEVDRIMVQVAMNDREIHRAAELQAYAFGCTDLLQSEGGSAEAVRLQSVADPTDVLRPVCLRWYGGTTSTSPYSNGDYATAVYDLVR